MQMENKEFQKDLIISGVLHLVLIIIFCYSMPPMFDKLPEPENVIMFDVLPVSSKVNIKTQSPKIEQKIEEKPATEIKKNTNLEKKSAEETKPEKLNKIEEVKKPIATIPTPKEEKAKIPPAPKVEKEKEKKPLKKEPKPIVKKKVEEDSIDSLLKNLEQESVKNQPNADEGEKFFKGDEFDQRSPMSITETMLIKKKIEENWRVPQSVQNLKNIKITAEIFLNKNGLIEKIDIINVNCPHNGQICALAKESIIRAIKATNQIENLSPTRYDTWKNLKLVFDPSSIF